MEYVGWEIVVTVDAGYTGGGFGDSRGKWSMVAVPPNGEDLRWSLPGRNTTVSGLILPGTRTLANMSNAAWVAWETAMTDPALNAPQTEAGAQGVIQGGRSTVRGSVAPRESVS
jgi:hypothetical protein